jgi:hypothetical protein
MSKYNRVPFAVIILGIMVLGAIMFVATQLVFRDQPDLQNLFSIIWTIALGVLIYRLFLNARSTRDPSKPVNLFGLIRFLMELFAVLTLLFTALMASIILTSPGNNLQLAVTVGITAFFALLLLVTPRILQMLNRREQMAEKQPKN